MTDRVVLPMGDRAVLVEVADGVGARRLRAALASAAREDVVELVTGARTVLVVATGPDHLDAVARWVETVTVDADAPDDDAGRTVEIDLRYDGPDLEQVAALLDIDTEELVARHVDESWEVAFAGFAPGFAYLVGTRHDWDVPRRDEPRTRVPAGSVGLAGPYSGVYPTASPGGWQLLGTTDVALFDVERDPPALLTPGTRVRFRQVGS